MDDDDDVGDNRAVSSSVQQLSDYSPMPAASAVTPHTAALPGNPAPVTVSPSIIPQMIFTLQNGNAMMVQPQPAFVTGTGYTPTMQLVSPVALAANTVTIPAQVCVVS